MEMTEQSRAATSGMRVRCLGMEKTVSPPVWVFGRLLMEWGQVSDVPIYDAVVRQWLAEGREVPRRPGSPWSGVRSAVDGGDLFLRA
ncbi:hypothetical protein [Streptomyces sp. A1136]|uniref:hypothetical protein n=1 Tax=Streptomyces sp. A1136 TaxID=2563102 RepID=UPI0014476668|nr:hypothetical protein [Streptomyces sp. A1136]